MLLKSPVLTTAVLVMLALGIGATTTMFSVINGVLLRPLPYKNPDRLVAIWQSNPQVLRLPTSVPNFADWRDQSRSFESMSWSLNQPVTVKLDDPEQLSGCIVPPVFFDVLGVHAARGRLLARGDPTLGVAILSWAAWDQRFGREPNIIGRKLETSMGSQIVVGVLPNSYRHPALADGEKEPEIWIPFDLALGQLPREQALLAVIGRLQPGTSVERARAEMAGIGEKLAAQYATNKGTRVEVVPLMDATAGRVRRPLWLLLGAVAILLLCACVNVANLLLARSIERRREFAIRAALGSSRTRAFQQVVTEGLLLSLAGGAIGVLLANLGVKWLLNAAGALIPRGELVHVGGTVLLFTLSISCLTGIGFASVPAFASSSVGLNEALKSGGRVAANGMLGHARSLLVISEIALALVLLAAAGLLMRTFWCVLNIDMGYAPEHVLTAEIPDEGSPSQNPNFLPDFLSRMKLVPGVQAAGAARALPLALDLAPMQTFDVVGRAAAGQGEIREAVIGVATPGYFPAMRIALRRGRLFENRDSPQAPSVALVNETFVRRYLPNEDPIGVTLDVGQTLQRRAPGNPDYILHGTATIVGVVADVRQTDLLVPPKPQIWNAYGQRHWLTMTVAIRTAGDPTKLAGILRSELRAVDSAKPLANVRTAEDYYSRALAQRRVTMILVGVLAVVALLLSALGVYGVIAYSVTRRTQEIGIRMALGARSGDLIRMVVREGLAMAGIGLMIGVPVALAAARLLRSILYEIKPHDPVTFAGLVLLFIAVAAAASYLPARKVSNVSPMEALRFE